MWFDLDGYSFERMHDERFRHPVFMDEQGPHPGTLGEFSMLDEKARFEANTGEVAASLMDGDVVLINLSTGVYYNTDNVGALIWQLIDLGFSVSEIVSTVADCYAAPEDAVRQDVQSFLEQLIEERIVLPRKSSGAPGLYKRDGRDSELRYENAVLRVYRDMGDLLALDAPMPNMDDIPWKGEKGG